MARSAIDMGVQPLCLAPRDRGHLVLKQEVVSSMLPGSIAAGLSDLAGCRPYSGEFLYRSRSQAPSSHRPQLPGG